MKGEAFVSAHVMLVRADVFFPGCAEQNRAGYEFERLAANPIAEAAAADIGNRKTLMLLDEWSVRRAGGASIVDDPERFALEECGNGHTRAILRSGANTGNSNSALAFERRDEA
jgi:hypothetical protein